MVELTQEIGLWRARKNLEVKELYNEANVVELIKSGQIKWFLHVIRREEEESIKAVMKRRMEGTRPLGRLKKIDR